MNTKQAVFLLTLVSIGVLGSSAYSNDLTYQDLRKIYEGAEKVKKHNINEIIRKTYECIDRYEDNSGSSVFFRLDPKSNHFYESYNGIELKLRRLGTLKSEGVWVKITSRKDLIIKDTNIFTQYTLCDANTARKGEQIKKYLEISSNEIIKHISVDKEGNIYSIIKDEINDQYKLSVRNKDGELVSEMSRRDFFKNLNIEGGYFSTSYLVTRGEKVFLAGTKVDDSYNSEYALVELKDDLSKSAIVKTYKALRIWINETGEDVKLSSAIGTFTRFGEISEKRNENNERGIEYVLNSGKIIWLNEYNPKTWNYSISDIFPNSDGSFYVIYNITHSFENESSVIYLFDKNGKKINSWGLRAPDNNAVILRLSLSQVMPKLQIVGNTLYTFKNNVVYTYELK